MNATDAKTNLAELSGRAVIIGMLIGLVMTAASCYLDLVTVPHSVHQCVDLSKLQCS